MNLESSRLTKSFGKFVKILVYFSYVATLPELGIFIYNSETYVRKFSSLLLFILELYGVIQKQKQFLNEYKTAADRIQS